MLSIENPPPDPSCPCQFPQLNTASSDEIERASHKQLPLPLPEVDLPNPPHTPLANFSIRDYVFAARSKDIKKNWPFSLKNLLLCLEHGVKDVLPPFQPLDTVRNQSIKRCTVETSSLQKENISNVDGEASRPNDHAVLLHSSDNAQLNHKQLPDTCIDTTSSCRSGGENDFPSTTTSVSQSEIESVHNNRPSSSSPPPIETDTLLEPSVEVEAAAAAPPVSHKTETTTRPPGKKCRLIVKFGGNCDRSSTEDIASNCTTVSETMASKVCPVCKTFSSSSNTTLNAHIDQCLSVESTPKWTADSKLTRHRIKPRRTRLMVDIYTTAKRCTLEELDRRNGRNWASVASMPTQETEKVETPAEGKKQRVSQVHPEDVGDVGPVYLDANGTKIRILSKFNQVSKVGEEDLGPRKPLKGSKGNKFLSTKKKKRHALKHDKYLKLASQSKKFYSHKAHASQISGGQERHYGEEESCEEDEHQIQKQSKSNDIGSLRQWVCSKRTGLAKKIINQDGNQPCKWHVSRDLLVDSDQSCLGDSLVERNRVKKFTNLSENMLSSPENSKRTEKPFYDARFSDKRERSSGRKRVGGSLLGTGISDNMERSLPPMKRNAIQLSKDSPSEHDNCMLKLPSSSRICVSSLHNKAVNIHTGPVNNSDIPTSVSRKPSMSPHATASKALKFSSSRKNVSSVGSRSSVIESGHNVMRKCSALRKTDSCFVTEIDEDPEAWHRESDQQHYGLMLHGTENQYGTEELTDEMLLGRGNVQDIRQDRGAVSISEREEMMALKSSQPAPQCYDHDEGENTDSSVRACDDILEKVDGTESVGGTVTSLRKSVDTKFHKLSIRSKTRSNSLRSIEDYRGPLCGGETLTDPTEPSFVDGQEMFCNDEIIGQDDHMGIELDTEVGEGNSFPEVDPIPIPGPPGSFLPSPRDMGSDDFPGNSSLTTSRVHSSQDQLDLVDGDSSDSPISAASTISNSTAAHSDLKFSEPLSSVGPQAVQDKVRSGFSTASFGSSVEHAATVPQTTSTGAERTTFDGETFKVNKIIEKRPLSFRNDDQPCCCQRKERVSPGIVLNFQESPLLRRRAMAPPMGKQLDCNPNTRPNNLDVRTGIFPLSSSTNLGSEKGVLPVMNSLAGSIPLKGSPDAGVKFSARTDCDSASPSASNPILRLMGKNLMVVSKDDDASVPLRQAQPCAQVNRPTSQFPTLSGLSPGNMHNHDSHSFHHMIPQGSLISGQDPHNTVGKCFDARLTDSYQSCTNSQTPQTPAHVPAGMFPNQRMDGFTAPMETHNYEGDCKLSSQQNRPKNRLNAASTYDHQHKNADSTVSSKEIIIIDDAPESEVNMTTDVARFSEGLRENQLASSGISIPTVCGYNIRHANAFSCYQSQDPSLLGESPMEHNTNFQATAFRRANTSPVRWNCTSEGSVVLQRSPFVTASSSTGHLRSPLYYSPTFP